MDKIRLLIVSEEPSARRGLTTIFTTENMFELLGALPLEEATEKASHWQPDAVLLDMINHISDYAQSIAELKNECPCSLIITLVDDNHSDNIATVLGQGVDGCVPRGIMRGCLVKSVELVCRGGLLCLPGYLKKTVCNGQRSGAGGPDLLQNTLPATGESLTRRELEILQLMAKNYSNRELADKLFISLPTVKTHVSNILRKLGQSNRAQAIVYSFQTGLITEPFFSKQAR